MQSRSRLRVRVWGSWGIAVGEMQTYSPLTAGHLAFGKNRHGLPMLGGDVAPNTTQGSIGDAEVRGDDL
jgi:hypothetical protein